MAETLATWLVEMDATSVKSLAGLLDQVNAKAGAVQQSLSNSGGGGTNEKLKDVAKVTQDIGDKAKATTGAVAAAAAAQASAWASVGAAVKNTAGSLLSFAASATGASAGLAGMIFVGVRGTAEMERLAFNFQQIAREIANIFAPAIRTVVDLTNRVLGAFRNLTGDQQAVVRNFVAAAGGAALFAAAAGSIIPRVAGIASAVSGLWAVMAANPITAIVGAIGAMLAGTEEGRSALSDMFDAVKPIFEAVGEVASVVADMLGPALTAIADIVRAVVVPVFELLKPVFELIAAVIRGIGSALSAIARFFGLTRAERENRPREQLNNASRGFEGFEQTWRSLQQAIARQDVPRAQLREQQQSNQYLAIIAGQPAPATTAAVAA